jgi:hypothetical protein
MKTLEKITKGSFERFEAFKLNSPESIRGGQATGGGSSGNSYTGYSVWDSDEYTGGVLYIAPGSIQYMTQEQWVAWKQGRMC